MSYEVMQINAGNGGDGNDYHGPNSKLPFNPLATNPLCDYVHQVEADNNGVHFFISEAAIKTARFVFVSVTLYCAGTNYNRAADEFYNLKYAPKYATRTNGRGYTDDADQHLGIEWSSDGHLFFRNHYADEDPNYNPTDKATTISMNLPDADGFTYGFTDSISFNYVVPLS